MNLAGIDAGVLERMVETIGAEADPDRVILFGSRARGDAAADSDVDLMVAEEGPSGPERNGHTETVRLIRALADFPAAEDILAYSREEAEYWRDSFNSVVAEALSEGGSCMSDLKEAGNLLRRAEMDQYPRMHDLASLLRLLGEQRAPVEDLRH